MNKTTLINRLGETDQIYLTQQSAAVDVIVNLPQIQAHARLAIERAAIRQALAKLSVHIPEQKYFLDEAAILLETALANAKQYLDLLNGETLHEDIIATESVVLTLSGQLAALYLDFFESLHKPEYLIVAAQILKLFSHHPNRLIAAGMTRLYALDSKPKLQHYWAAKHAALLN